MTECGNDVMREQRNEEMMKGGNNWNDTTSALFKTWLIFFGVGLGHAALYNQIETHSYFSSKIQGEGEI
jgi:hypothetical protein